MPKYSVTIYRYVGRSVDVEIEAKDADEAYDKAYDMAGDIDFGDAREGDAEYEIEIDEEDAEKLE